MIRDRKIWISGYRSMWMMVMFDLPVVEKKQRREANQFRNFLRNEGFAMAQYSIYYRYVANKEISETLVKKISENLPESGHVEILSITDKQYGNIKAFHGKIRKKEKKMEQLALF